ANVVIYPMVESLRSLIGPYAQLDLRFCSATQSDSGNLRSLFFSRCSVAEALDLPQWVRRGSLLSDSVQRLNVGTAIQRLKQLFGASGGPEPGLPRLRLRARVA